MGGLRLTVRDARALVANFVAADALAQRQARQAVARFNAAVVRDVRLNCAYDTGFMSRAVEGRVSPSGLSAEQGWWPERFAAAGLPYYPPHVELGTARQAAQPSLYPAVVKYAPRFADDVAGIIRRATDRARRAA